MLCQFKTKSGRQVVKYKYRYQVPRTIAKAERLDQQNDNTHWMDAARLELNQLDAYETFKDMGSGNSAPERYK